MGKYLKKKDQVLTPGWIVSLSILGVVSVTLAVMAIFISTDEDVPENTVLTTVDDMTTEPTLEPNPYQPEDFLPEGYAMTFSAGESQLGVDVSEHQMEISWPDVSEAGMEFAIVRIGYRGYTSGGIYEDSQASANLTGAKEAGLKVGAYFYSQAITPEEAEQEAAFCTTYLKNYHIDLPVVFDWEYVSEDARTGSMDRETLTEITRTFCRAIEKAGYQPMVYFNPSHASNYLDLIQLEDYPFWLALYSDTLDYPNKVEYWQYSHTGSIPGISVDADLNIRFMN